MKLFRPLFVGFMMLQLMSIQAQSDDHKISLISKKAVQPLNTFFYIDSVIDNRLVKTDIGMAQKGLFNKKVRASFERDFEKEIYDYCRSVLPPEENKQPFIIRMNTLQVSEKTTAFNELGIAVLNMDIIQRSPEGYLLKYRFSDTVKESGMDVTAGHDDRIKKLFQTAFENMMSKGVEGLESVVIHPGENVQFEIFDQDPPSGLYATYLELAALEVIENKEYQVTPHKKHPHRVHVEDKAGAPVLHYALVHESKLYLNAANYSADRYFVETRRVGKYLLFHDTFINPDKAAGMAGAFGMIGVAASNEGNHVLLDLETGGLFIIDNQKMKKALRKVNPRLYDLYRKNEKDLDRMKDLFDYLFKNQEQKNQVLEILRA